MKTILFTNTMSFSDDSSMAADLAKTIANYGKNVALIDCDLRQPAVHKLFKLPNKLGFSDVLQNNRSPLSVMHTSMNQHLSILTSGSHLYTNFEIFNSQKMHVFLKRLKNDFDNVIIHGPPFFYAEALSLAKMVDRVVLLIHPNTDHSEKSLAIIDKFHHTGATIVSLAAPGQSIQKVDQTAFTHRHLNLNHPIEQASSA